MVVYNDIRMITIHYLLAVIIHLILDHFGTLRSSSLTLATRSLSLLKVGHVVSLPVEIAIRLFLEKVEVVHVIINLVVIHLVHLLFIIFKVVISINDVDIVMVNYATFLWLSIIHRTIVGQLGST